MNEHRVELPYIEYEWALRVEDCPCDVHFVQWLDEQAIVDSTIFHFGTGAHHYVGIECAQAHRRNAVVGITASPEEHGAFVRLAIASPAVLRSYQAIFGDIYLLNPKLLPRFDVVTLFHLCEFRVWEHDAMGAMTDLELLNLLTDQTRPGGHLLFYQGSHAWDWNHVKARDVVAAWAQQRDVERVGTFRTLLVYRRRS